MARLARHNLYAREVSGFFFVVQGNLVLSTELIT